MQYQLQTCIGIFLFAALISPELSFPASQDCQKDNTLCTNLVPYLTDTPTFSIRDRKPLTSQYDLVQLVAHYGKSQRITHGFFLIDTHTEEQVLTLATFPTEIGTDYHLLSATPETMIIQKSGSYGFRDDKVKYFFDLDTKTVSYPHSYPNVSIEKALVVENTVFLAGHTKNWGDVLLRLTLSEKPQALPTHELIHKLEGKSLPLIRELRLKGSTVMATSQNHSYHFNEGSWSVHPPLTKMLQGADGSTSLRVLDLPSSTDRFRLEFPHTPGGPTIVLVWDEHMVNHLKPSPGYGMTRYQSKQSSFTPMPQPTYQDFQRIRPDRVDDGYTEDITNVGNALGPWLVEGNQIWFGTTFYDGEGETGIGGFGTYDVTTSQINMAYLPEVASWSISTIFVSNETLSMGLVGHPEGAEYSGGLVQYHIKTQQTRHIDIPEIIQVITQVYDTLVLGTTNGVTLLQGQTLHTGTFDIDQENNYRLIWHTSSLPTPAEE